jgi:hypothetical protein
MMVLHPESTKQFQSKQGKHRMAGRNQPEAWKPRFLEQLIEGDLSQRGQKEKKGFEASPALAGSEVQLAHIGNRGGFGMDGLGAFLVPTVREPTDLEDSGFGIDYCLAT